MLWVSSTAHCAAVKGSRDSLEVLRKQGVDLWQPTAKGDYPIHEAAQAGHVGTYAATDCTCFRNSLKSVVFLVGSAQFQATKHE